MALVTAGISLGASATNQAKADGFVCVGTTMYASHGWWIFQFPYGVGLENAAACEGY